MAITFNGAFGKMGEAETNAGGGGRGNEPKDGTGDFMLRQVRKAGGKEKFRFLIDLKAVVDSDDGVYTKGEEIQVCIHKSKFDGKGANVGKPCEHETLIKPWILALCGVVGDDDTLVIQRGKQYFEINDQGDDYEALDELTQRAASWMGMSRLFTATDDDDEPTGEPGLYDGQAILRINFNTTPPRPRKDGSGDPMYEQDGSEKMTKPKQYTNVRTRIAMDDVVGDFSPADIKEFFGDDDNMGEILESEAEEFAELKELAEASA